jgi:Spy/CpxP family protein refolding chaperone
MMKISRFFPLALCTLSAALWAQQAPPGFKVEPMPMPLNRPVNADDHLHMLTEQLNLTHPQQDKIRPILEKYLKQRHAILMSKSLSQDAKSNKLQIAEDAEHARIRPLLNAEQKKKFDDLMGTSEPPHRAHKQSTKQARSAPSKK